MPQVRRPRRGSLQFHPRVRSKRMYPTITTYPITDKPKALAFAGYKSGMLHAMISDNNKNSPTFGQEISVPVTVLDCPPLKVIGIRAYKNSYNGLSALKEAIAKDLPKNLSRKINIGEFKTEENLSAIEKNLDKVSNLRLIVSTQPKLSGIGKKTPEIFEIEIGGANAGEKLTFAKQVLGKEIKPSDVVKEGELVDTVAITKGKGTVGPVKRYGVKIQNRHAKQKRRHVGAIAAQTPGRVLWTSPMAGQFGLFTRTELNKRILKIGDGVEINPKSGFTRYGIIKSNYILVQGSVPGAKKRLVLLRPAIRPSKIKLLVPEIKQVVK
ncbi:MAG: 50S ribosomal protein L3 [Candidatus Aenigmarchaeota archaeon]|nr:50S ribosomal protein L3 [Candidatus Aenigmarchaeota archaeon]